MATLISNMTIETERVIIRPIVASDAAAFHKIESAAETSCFLGKTQPQTKTIEAITYDIERHGASWQALAVIEKATSNFIGRCGYLGMIRPEEPEIHIVLSKDYWGKGLATEIGHALLLHGFQKRELTAITGVVHPEHKASIRILEKLGMKYVGKRSEDSNNRQSGFLIYRVDRSGT
jgi:[ribosomal protein S5]-alanine N-acetyltransferase